MQETERRVNERKQELENKRFDWGGLVAFSFAAAAIGIITLGTGGAGSALLPYAPSLLSLAGLTFIDPSFAGLEQGLLKQTPDIANKLKKIAEESKGIKDLESWKKVGNVLEPVVISFGKIIEQLNQASGDAELINFLKELTELVHAKLLAELRDRRADLALEAATVRFAVAQGDLSRAEDQLTRLNQGINVLDEAALTLIRSAQRDTDVLIQYAFRAARALEIYTLADLSGEIQYNYGYIYPDLEQDYLEGITSRADILSAYVTSWSQLLTLDYRQRYESYFEGRTWVDDSYFRSFSDPAVLAQFRQSRTLLFTVGLSDLPQSRYEAKVTGVRVSLVGATATAPAISCVIEHSGRFTQKKFPDGIAMEFFLKPKIAIVQAAKSSLAFSGVVTGTNPRTLGFWGRGVAAVWTLSIEAEEITQKDIDFSSLSSIEIEIEYEAFLKPGEVSLLNVELGDANVTIQLSEPAPSSGISVALTSSDLRAVEVPTTVTIPEGSTTITLPITKTADVLSNDVILTASFAGLTKRISLS